MKNRSRFVHDLFRTISIAFLVIISCLVILRGVFAQDDSKTKRTVVDYPSVDVGVDTLEARKEMQMETVSLGIEKRPISSELIQIMGENHFRSFVKLAADWEYKAGPQSFDPKESFKRYQLSRFLSSQIDDQEGITKADLAIATLEVESESSSKSYI